MKRLLSFILSAGLILSLAACEKATTNGETTKPEPKEVLQTQEPEQPSENSAATPTEEAEKVYNYDALQSIFMEITKDTTTEELWALISENDLSVTAEEYNKLHGGEKVVFCIAYTEGSAQQKYADSGDYLEVTFDILGDNFMSNENCFMSAEYVSTNYALCSGFYYEYGTWREFDEEAENSYSGYYIIDGFSEENGITIQYSNGYEKTVPYFRQNSAEEVVQKMIDSAK